MLLLVALELALRALGVGADRPPHDPFAGFSRVVPLFERATRPDGTPVFALSAARQRSATGRASAEPQREFLAEKPPGHVPHLRRRRVVRGRRPLRARVRVPVLARAAPRRRAAGRARRGGERRRLRLRQPARARRRPRDRRVTRRTWSSSTAGTTSSRSAASTRTSLVDLDPRLFRLWELVVGSRLYALVSRGRHARAERRAAAPRPERRRPRRPDVRGGEGARRGPHAAAARRGRVRGDALPLQPRGDGAEIARAGARPLFVTVAQDFADWAPGASQHAPGLGAPRSRASTRPRGGRPARRGRGTCDGRCRPTTARRRSTTPSPPRTSRRGACLRTLGRWDDARDGVPACQRPRRRAAGHPDPVQRHRPRRGAAERRPPRRRRGPLRAREPARARRRRALRRLRAPEHPRPAADRGRRSTRPCAAAGLPVPGRPVARSTAGSTPTPLRCLAADPKLRLREHLVRAIACDLALRAPCALAEVDAVLAIDPSEQGGAAAAPAPPGPARPLTAGFRDTKLVASSRRNALRQERRRPHRVSGGGRRRPGPGARAGLGVARRVCVGGPVVRALPASAGIVLAPHPARSPRHRTLRP